MKNDVKKDEFIKLDANSIAKGIGRKATDGELVDYLSRDSNAEPICLEIVFSKYTNNKL